MLCPTCTKIVLLPQQKKCVRCQAPVLTNLGVLCEGCSNKHRQCAVCLKNVVPEGQRPNRGCGCGGKK